MFFIDLDGAVGDPAVSAAIAGLRDKAESVRVLGSYPSPRPGSRTPNRAANTGAFWPPSTIPATWPSGHPGVAQVDAAGVAAAKNGVVRLNGASPNGHTTRPGGRVLVLNASYEPINVCTTRRATVLLLKERAECSSATRASSTPSASRSSAPA